MTVAPTPTLADVERIAGGAEPVLRNLQITLCYADLSGAMGAVLPANANWCTFAVWASKQAGVTIRDEDLERAVRARLVRSGVLRGPILRVIELVGGTVEHHVQVLAKLIADFGPFRRSSDAVARGNKKVYEEIGREFARFLPLVAEGRQESRAAIDEFCNELRPGAPPDGQGLLRDAFHAYYRARFDPDPDACAQLALLANLKIGFHEQSRLQPEIAEALDAAVVPPAELQDLVHDAIVEQLPLFGRLMRFALPWIRRRYKALAAEIAAELADVAEDVATQHLMSIMLPPDRILSLARDLDLPIPAPLETLRNEDLVALLAPLEPTPGSLEGTGARDWADLDERMRFIAALFRCEQQDALLNGPPFTAAQIERIRAGAVPDGQL